MAHTATCYCGAVQLSFSFDAGDKKVTTFVCHCTDCRKITASMFATNFVLPQSYMTHIRGKDELTKYLRTENIDSGNQISSHFCRQCGTLMYRISSEWPDHCVMRVGTVDEFKLHETLVKPSFEMFVKDRVVWCAAADGVKQISGNGFTYRRNKSKL